MCLCSSVSAANLSCWAALRLFSLVSLCSAVSAACLSHSVALFLCNLTCLSSTLWAAHLALSLSRRCLSLCSFSTAVSAAWWALSRSLLHRSLSPLELAECITNTDHKVSKLKYSRWHGVHMKSIEKLIVPKIRAMYDLRHGVWQIDIYEWKIHSKLVYMGLTHACPNHDNFSSSNHTPGTCVAGTTCLWGKLTCKNHAYSLTFPW